MDTLCKKSIFIIHVRRLVNQCSPRNRLYLKAMCWTGTRWKRNIDHTFRILLLVGACAETWVCNMVAAKGNIYDACCDNLTPAYFQWPQVVSMTHPSLCKLETWQHRHLAPMLRNNPEACTLCDLQDNNGNHAVLSDATAYVLITHMRSSATFFLHPLPAMSKLSKSLFAVFWTEDT